MPKKTQLPQRIVSFLRRHPTANRQHVADALGVSYQAVQKHLRKMEASGQVKPGFFVTDAWESGRHEFWIFIETRHVGDPGLGDTRLRSPGSGDSGSAGDGRGGEVSVGAEGLGDYQADLCAQIAERLTHEVEWTEALSFLGIEVLLGGDWDIVLRVASDQPDAVGHFVTRYLRSRPAVVRTRTCWTLDRR